MPIAIEKNEGPLVLDLNEVWSSWESWLRTIYPGREIKPCKRNLYNSQKITFKLGDKRLARIVLK